MFGMMIEDVSEGRDEVKVTTTGATYVFNKSSQGEVFCYQRIGSERLVATLVLHTPLQDLAVDWSNKEFCFLHQPVPDLGVGMRINSDSVLSIRSGREIKATYHGDWVPEYSAVERGNFMLMDERGGIGAYPLGLGGYEVPKTSLKFSKDGWQISIFLRSSQRFLTSVFPPRPFEWTKSFKDRIVHHFFSHPPTKPWNPYPRNDEIEEYSKHGNILVLHWWQHGLRTRKGRGLQSRDDFIQNSAWTSFRLKTIDDKEMRRTVDKAHELGLRVIAYMTPFYFPGEPDEFLREMDSVLKQYWLDGAYFDGVSVDVLQGYCLMRAVRRLLGDKILYAHVPSPIIGECYGDGYYVYCPFIDTYADYILRAEHIFAFDWKHLRYTISGYNISNSIGFVCNYDYEPKFTRQLMKHVLKANARLPYWVGFDAYVKERQKVIGRKYYPLEESRKIMREEYFPALDAMQKKHK